MLSVIPLLGNKKIFFYNPFLYLQSVSAEFLLRLRNVEKNFIVNITKFENTIRLFVLLPYGFLSLYEFMYEFRQKLHLS